MWAARWEQTGPRKWAARRKQAGTREWAAWRVAHVDVRLGLGSTTHWAWSNMAWALALDGTDRVVVMAPWTSPWVATVVATAVVPVVETRGGGAAPLRITFNLVDRRGPNSCIFDVTARPRLCTLTIFFSNVNGRIYPCSLVVSILS